jgi:hypothetical protein
MRERDGKVFVNKQALHGNAQKSKGEVP